MSKTSKRSTEADKTCAQVFDVMHVNGARRIAEVAGPNDSLLMFYATARGCVIVQVFADGGCTHYAESATTTWDAMHREVAEMMSPREVRP